MKLFLVLIFVLVAFLLIGYLGTKLAAKHGSDVRIVWYFFSFSSVCTLIIAIWASSVGAIDPTGGFQGHSGKWINALLAFMLDLDTDIKVFLALLAIFVVPQIATYFLSGLFGCATAPLMIGRAASLFLWSVVKSLVVASGIILTIAIYGLVQGWVAWSLEGAGYMTCLSLTLLMLSFACLCLYRDISEPVSPTDTKKVHSIKLVLKKVSAWLTRNVPSKLSQ